MDFEDLELMGPRQVSRSLATEMPRSVKYTILVNVGGMVEPYLVPFGTILSWI
jgi:hypothetical protein